MTNAVEAAPAITFSKLKIWRKAHSVSDMAQASKAYRDSVGDRGASMMPNGLLLDQHDRQVGYVSYNGKIWAGTEYDPEAVPLYVPTFGAKRSEEQVQIQRQNCVSSPYTKAAELLGWKWSNAHGGFISEGHRNGSEWKDYFVADDAEDACFHDGIENEAQAAALIRRREEDAALGL